MAAKNNYKDENTALKAENLQLLKEWRIMDKENQANKIKNAQLQGDVSTLTKDCNRLVQENDELTFQLNLAKGIIKELNTFITGNMMKYDTKNSREVILLKKSEAFVKE